MGSDREMASAEFKVPLERASKGSPLRIVHIINGLGLGGAETLLYRLIARDCINEHVVVSLGKTAWYSSKLREQGISVHHLNMHSGAAVAKGALRLNSILRDTQADLVQCWMYRSNLLGGLVARAAGKPVVWGIHHATISTMRARSRALVHLGGIFARWTPNFIINCSRRSAEIHSRLGYSVGRCTVVHNGYDPEEFFPDERARTATRERLAIGADRFVVGTISRWHSEKDIPNLLKALEIARRRDTTVLCLLIGANLTKQNEHLANVIRDSGCEALVMPLGLRSDVSDLARAFDLHVLPSCSEAFPSVVAETMLSGTPNAVTDVGDAALMVGESGWVVPPKDPESLATAIVEASREFRLDPGCWSARRRESRDRIAGNFSLDLMTRKYLAIWREVAKETA